MNILVGGGANPGFSPQVLMVDHEDIECKFAMYTCALVFSRQDRAACLFKLSPAGAMPWKQVAQVAYLMLDIWLLWTDPPSATSAGNERKQGPAAPGVDLKHGPRSSVLGK